MGYTLPGSAQGFFTMPEPVELKSKVLEGSRSGAHLLITGGVHGDEFESMTAIRQLMHQLDPARLRGRVTLVPVVNEPAFRRGQRTAEDNLDLARTCPGRPDGSITQRLAHALSTLIRSADYYIDLHTGGSVFDVYPLAGYGLVPDGKVLQAQRRMARAFNLPLIWGTTCRLEGRSLSVARDAKVPAIYCEWRGAAVCDPEGCQTYVEGCLNVMAALDMLDRAAPISRTQYVVEDDRDQSGHLQIQNPAPIAGHFTPAVKLGQVIAKDDRIGTVCDILGEQVLEVRTPTGGLVNLLRSFPRVEAGDALASIVELQH